MNQHLEPAKAKFTKAVDHFKSDLQTVRSGRATPALVEHVKVEAYGTITPLIELASITAPEPKIVIVSPWDKNILKDVERALTAANLGMSPIIDGAVIRLNLPSLTEERRRELVKLVNSKHEDAKGVIRRIREEVLKMFKDRKAEGAMPEDEFFMVQKDLQKLVDEINSQVKNLAEEKEKEVMTI